MLSESQKNKIEQIVLRQYKKKYPHWSGVQVTEIKENKYFDITVSVKSNDYPDGEICLYKNGEVTIFDSTPELVRHLELKAKHSITQNDFQKWFILVICFAALATLSLAYKNTNVINAIIAISSAVAFAVFGIKRKSEDIQA